MMSGPSSSPRPRRSRSGGPIRLHQLQPPPRPPSTAAPTSAFLCPDHAIFIRIHHVASCKILRGDFSIQGPFAPPLPPTSFPPSPPLHIPHFSNSCCCKHSASSTSVCFASFFLSLSSLCECESRLRIKSHLKASPPSPCASCVPCFLVSINSTTLTGTLAPPPVPAVMTPHPYRDFFGFCYAHGTLFFMSVCMPAWTHIFMYVHVGQDFIPESRRISTSGNSVTL